MGNALSIGLCAVLGGVLTGVLFNGLSLFGGLVLGLVMGPMCFVLFIVFSGLSVEMLDTHKLVVPNRGIWRSAHYVLSGMLGAALGGVLLGFFWMARRPKRARRCVWPRADLSV